MTETMHEETVDPVVPVTLLTGFLGAGKTTLVNHLLTASHGRRIGVIVNEFGELGIDAALIRGASGSVIELANGCVCCATKGDLARAVQETLSGSRGIEALLIETSGLADPEPVIADLEGYRFARETRLDGVVTVIDAANFDRNLDSAEAAFQQITHGDVLLVNKVDLVGDEIPGLIESGLRRLNPRARVLPCTDCDVPLDVLFGVARTEAPRVRHAHDEHDHDEHHHDHAHGGFTSLSLSVDRPLDRDRFAAWLDGLPVSVFRLKGFVRFADRADPVVVHGVGERRTIEPPPPGLAVAGAALVLIGQGVAEADLLPGLRVCAA